MTDTLAGMALMATLALWLRARRLAPGLWPAARALVLFCGALAGVLLLDASPWSDWSALLQPVLPLALAYHLAALVGEARWRRRDTALALGGGLCLPYLLAPAEARGAIAAGAVPDLDPRYLLAMLAGVGLFWLGLIAVTALSAWRIVGLLRRSRARLAQIVAAPASARLSGVALLSGFLAVIFGLELLDLVSLGAVLGPAALDGFLLVLILGTALHGLSLREIWPDWAAAALAPRPPAVAPALTPAAAPAEPSPPEPSPSGPSYARSGLDGEGIAQLLARLDAAMARGALWRAPGLTLADLAATARAKPFYVSQALNQGRGESFYDYVNRARIAEAQTLLRETDQTALAIAMSVGFNAKSTFNAAFRKATGMTPSQWRASGPAGPDAVAGGVD